MRALLVALIALGLPSARADELKVDSEPVQNGDDRVGKRLEAGILAQAEAFLACRSQVATLPEPLRFVGLEVRMRLDGTVAKVKVVTSSGSTEVDACTVRLVGALQVDPPPTFRDLLAVGVTWAIPAPVTP